MYQQKWVNDLLFNTFASSTHPSRAFFAQKAHTRSPKMRLQRETSRAMEPTACTPFLPCVPPVSVYNKCGKWPIYLLLVSLPFRRRLPAELLAANRIVGKRSFSGGEWIARAKKEQSRTSSLAIFKEVCDDDDLRSGKKASNVSRRRNLVSTLALTWRSCKAERHEIQEEKNASK